MERVGTLIHKLLEQYQQQAGTGKLLLTAQMLMAELKQYQQESEQNAHSRVAAVLPSVALAKEENTMVAAASVNEPAQKESPALTAPAAVIAAPAEPVVEKTPEAPVTIPVPETVELEMPAPAKLEEQPVVVNGTSKEDITLLQPQLQPQPQPQHQKQNGSHGSGWMFDPVQEVPTLTHQAKNVYELNEAMASHGESLNERLRVEKIELGSVLQEAPIRDLKKAIGINDRYLFINELFRGDETMYERSIKTINGFNIFPEADFWIQRELKLKLGWNEESQTVHHFDQLVKRRFS